MKKALARAAVILLVVVAGVGGYLYNAVTSLEHEQVTEDVYAIFDAGGHIGGNVGVLRTDAGTVVVDSMTFGFQGKRVRALAEELTGKPVVLLINTHYHEDHTHGNPGFASDTRIVSSSRTRELLLRLDPEYWGGDATAFLPDETFSSPDHLIELGGKTIRLVHPGPAHTDGDVVVLFVEDRVVHTGDVVWNGRYPNVDLEGGCSVRQWPAAIDHVLELGRDFDRVIPGHGPVTDHDGIRAFQRFVAELWEVAKDAADRGLSIEQTLAEIELTQNAGMTDFVVPFILRFDHDFVLRRAWEEATGSFTPPPPSAAISGLARRSPS